jgi:hypothetical protein
VAKGQKNRFKEVSTHPNQGPNLRALFGLTRFISLFLSARLRLRGNKDTVVSGQVVPHRLETLRGETLAAVDSNCLTVKAISILSSNGRGGGIVSLSVVCAPFKYGECLTGALDECPWHSPPHSMQSSIGAKATGFLRP